MRHVVQTVVSNEIAFELIFIIPELDAYVIYSEDYPPSRSIMQQFRENLFGYILLGMPFEKLKTDLRERSIC